MARYHTYLVLVSQTKKFTVDHSVLLCLDD